MYFVRRILFAIPLLLVISLLTFGLVHLAPGGPFDAERKPASPEIERNIKEAFHANDPIWKQYLRYFGLVWSRDANGQWHHDPPLCNISYKYRNHTVLDIVEEGLPVSMTLGGLSFCFAMAVGLPLGFLTAARRGSRFDSIGSFIAVLTICVPNFVVAPVLILIFAIKLDWLPVGLWGSPWHMVLPVIALGSFFVGKIARIMREGMLSAGQSEFITAARAKGLGENTLLFKHALRIALLPVVSYAGPMLADLLTGSFVVENIFQIPGIGVFLVNSSLNFDYNIIVGLSLLYAAMLIGLNLAVDFAYTLFDPRVKYE